MRDQVGRARVFNAGGQAIGDAQLLLHFAQRQDASARRQRTAVEFDHDRFAGDG